MLPADLSTRFVKSRALFARAQGSIAGGAQTYYGVQPDLMILGKAIGGGTPFAALAGRAFAFQKIVEGNVVHAGTLNANPLCLVASKWCLDEVQELGGDASRPSE